MLAAEVAGYTTGPVGAVATGGPQPDRSDRGRALHAHAAVAADAAADGVLLGAYVVRRAEIELRPVLLARGMSRGTAALRLEKVIG